MLIRYDDPTNYFMFYSAHDPRMAHSGEIGLWREVLRLAIEDLFSPAAHAPGKYFFIHRRENHYSAVRWVKETGGTFEFCCDALGLDASVVRMAVLARLEAMGGSEAILNRKEVILDGYKRTGTVGTRGQGTGGVDGGGEIVGKV